MLNETTLKTSTWALCEDPNTKEEYFWNTTYHYSVWKNDLSPYDDSQIAHSNRQIWDAFVDLQRKSIYKQCAVCKSEITSHSDFRLCIFCGSTVHNYCFTDETHGCRFCSPKNLQMPLNRVPNPTKCDSLLGMIRRMKTLMDDFSPALREECISLMETYQDVQRWKDLIKRHFQGDFQDYRIQPIRNKGNTLGVISTQQIPPYTRIGTYPGYADPLCAHQCQNGRPIPKFLLEKMNCADYSNRIFEEFNTTLAPYVNEPNLDEKANCGWLIEIVGTRRTYSLLTIRTVQPGEELMVGYGPSFQRDYEFWYDHYVLVHSHSVIDGDVYNLVHWESDDAEDSSVVCSVSLAKRNNETG